MADVSYMAAVGHNNPGGMVRLAFQPATPEGIQWPELVYGGDGSANYNGTPFVVLKFSGGIDEDDRNQVIGQFGLGDSLASGPVAYANVTVQIPDNDGSAIVCNGIASLPERKRRTFGFYEDFEITITDLEVI